MIRVGGTIKVPSLALEPVGVGRAWRYEWEARTFQSRRLLSLSYVEGPKDPPLDHRTLSVYFREEILGKYAERPALVCRQERPSAHGGPPSSNMGVSTHLAWDFQEFHRHIDAVARGTHFIGCQEGGSVSRSYALLQWACASVGAILVTLNPAYRLNRTPGVSHLFAVPRIRSSRYLRMLSDAFPDLRYSNPGNIQAEALPALRNLVIVDNIGNPNEYQQEVMDTKSVIDWRETLVWREDGLEQRRLKELIACQQSDEVTNLQFTSGTTGAPKAASLTHFNILNNGLGNGRCMRFTSDDVLCNVPPLFHCFDKWNLAAWSHGACIVYPSEVFNPKAIVDAVSWSRECHRHRTGIAAGSPIPIDLMRQLIDKLNLVDLHRCIWNDPVSFQTTPADPIIKRVETVGKVQPHVRAKIINPEGAIVPVGTPGELCVTGYLLQRGYWEDEEQTRDVMRRDAEDKSTVWMHTGDEGIMDDEGYLRIVGRIKDIIIRGGENLFPVQIENVLTAHPSIREAAAVSVPDGKYGEVVGAWILLEPGVTMSEGEVRQVVSNNMNPQNAPAWVWFVGDGGSAQELPKTASGKVMKHILRKWSSELAESEVGKVEP
ncbi:hypothetical protein BU15DRAFT_88107 [Melanogaster broomeanus]|nr:hypothetical protein BU15DRAFT_88107 [Melanogaster broomeanus]